MSHDYDFDIDPRVQRLSRRELSTFRESVRQLIPLRIDGIDYAEGRRGQLVSLAGAVLSLGIALIPLSNLIKWTPLRWAFVAFGAFAILTGMVSWTLYIAQINYPYPFVGQVKTWKWFYHGALSDSSKFGPSIPQILGARFRRPRAAAAKQAIKASPRFLAEQREVARQYGIFSQQVDGLSQTRIDATQDLRQLYLLHLNEHYKNKFLTQLRIVISVGISFTVIAALIALTAGVLLHHSPRSATSSKSSVGRIVISATWAPTGRTRSDGISSLDIEYRLIAVVTDHGESSAAIGDLVALDDSHRPIPAEFSFPPHAPSLAAGASATIVGYMWLPAEEVNRVRIVNVAIQ